MLDWIGVWKQNGDLRVIASAIMGSAGTAYTAIEAVKGFLQGRTSVSKIKEQRAHATEVINFLERLRRGAQGQPIPSSEAVEETCRHLERERDWALKRCGDLMSREAKLRQDPNHDLRLFERLFVLFRPEGLRQRVTQAFTHLLMAGGPILIVYLAYNHDPKSDTFADTIALLCYLMLVLRAWALAERQWSLSPTYDPPGMIRDIFVFRRPLNVRMRVAQISMWCCLFWVIEGLEDLTFHIFIPHSDDDLAKDSLSFLLSVMATCACRAWAAAEQKSATARQLRSPWDLLFAWPGQTMSTPWLPRSIYLAIVIFPLPVLFRLFTPDIFDVTGVSLTWPLLCVACDQLLYLWLQQRLPAAHSTMA